MYEDRRFVMQSNEKIVNRIGIFIDDNLFVNNYIYLLMLNIFL